MLVDGGFDGGFVHLQPQIAGAQLGKQGLAQLRAPRPNRLARHIGNGDAAVQVACHVLPVFGHAGVDIARQVEVEVVALNLVQADHARVLGHFGLLGEYIDDAVNVALAQAVFGARLS